MKVRSSKHHPNAFFMSRVRYDAAAPDCWIWVGSLVGRDNAGGPYGTMRYAGVARNAHRVAWLLFRGPIPEGLQVDHLCRNRRCVNPLHLEPVSQRENILRGVGFAARNAQKTHCIRGHEFTTENTIRQNGGHRACRSCVYAKNRAYYQSKKSVA